VFCICWRRVCSPSRQNFGRKDLQKVRRWCRLWDNDAIVVMGPSFTACCDRITTAGHGVINNAPVSFRFRISISPARQINGSLLMTRIRDGKRPKNVGIRNSERPEMSKQPPHTSSHHNSD